MIESQFTELTEKVNALSRQVAALQRRTLPAPDLNGETKLGFVDHISVPRTWVYVGEKEGACWYTVSDEKPSPIHEQALVGTLRRVFGAKRSGRGKPVFKICLEVDAGSHVYVVQSGIDTLFTHGVIGALEAADPETLKGHIAIKVRSGDSGKVVFGSIFSMPSAHWIKAPEGQRFSKSSEVAGAARTVCEKLGVEWEVKDFTNQAGSGREA